MRDTMKLIFWGITSFLCFSCTNTTHSLQNGHTLFEINKNMQTRVLWKGAPNQPVDYGYSDMLITEEKAEYAHFTLTHSDQQKVSDQIGMGQRYTFQGDSLLKGGK